MNGETIFLLSIFFFNKYLPFDHDWILMKSFCGGDDLDFEQILPDRWNSLLTHIRVFLSAFLYPFYILKLIFLDFVISIPRNTITFFLNKVNMLFKHRPFDNTLLYSSIKKSMFYSSFYLFRSCPFHFSIRIILCNLN